MMSILNRNTCMTVYRKFELQTFADQQNSKSFYDTLKITSGLTV